MGSKSSLPNDKVLVLSDGRSVVVRKPTLRLLGVLAGSLEIGGILKAKDLEPREAGMQLLAQSPEVIAATLSSVCSWKEVGKQLLPDDIKDMPLEDSIAIASTVIESVNPELVDHLKNLGSLVKEKFLAGQDK